METPRRPRGSFPPVNHSPNLNEYKKPEHALKYLSRADKDLAKDGRVQDAGVEKGAGHPSSRRNSAFR